MLGIQVFRHQRQGASAAAGGLGMQPQEESVEGRVISVAAATRRISSRRPSGSAVRVLRSLRGLGTRAAGFSLSVRMPSATAYSTCT